MPSNPSGTAVAFKIASTILRLINETNLNNQNLQMSRSHDGLLTAVTTSISDAEYC
jgi:hypothetical protein